MIKKYLINIFQKATLVISSIIFFLIILELFLNVTNLDTKMLEPSLAYQYTDLEVYKVSENSNMLYSLIPNTSFNFQGTHEKETKYQSRNVTINNLGFRDIKDRNKIKVPGVFRIIILGGSNTYGALVSDQDTYPVIMQKKLDEMYPEKYEVWNAGISAYVLSQKAAYARNIIGEFDPDLVIIQDFNVGRRNFLDGSNFIPLFKKNKELYLENVPIYFDAGYSKTSYFLVYNFAFYRFFITSYYNILNNFNIPISVNGGRDYADFNVNGNRINERNFKNLIEDYKDKVDIVLFKPVTICTDQFSIDCFSLCNQNQCEEDSSNEYHDIHPPSYVYELYADELIDYLSNTKTI